VTSAYVCPYRLWGRGTRVSRQSDGGGEYHLFSAGNRAVLLGDRCFSWREIAGLPSLLKKRVFKSLACSAKRFSSIKLNFRTWEKYQISINGKKEFNRVLSCLFGGKQKLLGFYLRCRFRVANSVGTTLEFSVFRSGPHPNYSRASAFWVFVPQPWFLQWSEHIFPEKQPPAINKQPFKYNNEHVLLYSGRLVEWLERSPDIQAAGSLFIIVFLSFFLFLLLITLKNK